jgi:hypothetical protein
MAAAAALYRTALPRVNLRICAILPREAKQMFGAVCRMSAALNIHLH